MRSIRGTLSGLKKNPEGIASYDSLLERDYMIELEQDPAVRRWTKKHGIKIPYKFLGLFMHEYLPDFLVEHSDGSKELHEGKGLPLLFWSSTKTKRAAAERWCKERGMKYKVVTRGRQIFYISNFIERSGVQDTNDFRTDE